MGRLSRYKKVKSVDPYAKNGSSWKSDIGDCSTLHRVKRKSKTALKMKEQKMSKLQRRVRGNKGEDSSKTRGTKSGGSNGWGDDDGYDLPPDGGDEFDLNDLLGSVKKQRHKSNLLLDTNSVAQPIQTVSEKYTRKFQKVSEWDVAVASKGNEANNNSKKQTNNSITNKKDTAKKGESSAITAKTSIREIIESCSHPKSNKQSDVLSSSTEISKQEKRKAFFDKKKLKKRKRSNGEFDGDNSDDDDNQLHNNSSNKMTFRRPAFDDQVERPPTFTMLPRGANKLAKNRKATQSGGKKDDNLSDDDNLTAMRIRKEQQALEAMRERVMKQYAILRESRRGGSDR